MNRLAICDDFKLPSLSGAGSTTRCIAQFLWHASIMSQLWQDKCCRKTECGTGRRRCSRASPPHLMPEMWPASDRPRKAAANPAGEILLSGLQTQF